MRKVFYLLFYLLSAVNVLAVVPPADDFKSKFIEFEEFENWGYKIKTSYIDSINIVARNNTRIDRKISSDHANHALNFSLKINYKRGEAFAYRTVASLNLLNNNYSNAIDYIFKSIEIFESLKDSEGIADANFTLGLIYRKLNKYKKSVDAHKAAYDYYKNSNDLKRKGTAAYNLSESYFYQNNYQLTVKHLQESIEIAESLDYKLLLGNSYNLKSKVLLSKNQEEEAIKHLNKSIKISEKLGKGAQKETYIQALMSKADILKNRKNYEEQIKCLETALLLSEKYIFTEYYTDIYFNLIDALFKVDNVEKAKAHLANYNTHRKNMEEKLWEERVNYIFQTLEMGLLVEQNAELTTLNEQREEKIEIVSKTIIIGIYCLLAFLIGTVYTIRLLGKSKKNEAQLNAFFENAPLGIVFLDKDLRIIKINQTLEEFLGWNKEQLKDKLLLEELAISNNKISVEEIVLQYKSPKEFIYKNPQSKIFELRLNITQIDLKGVSFHIAFIEDKTLKKKILRKNLELNELLYETYRIAGIGSYEIFYSEKQGFTIQSFSEVAKEIIGLKGKVVPNSIFEKLIPKEELVKYFKIIKQFTNNNEYFDHELKVYHTKGHLLYLRVIGKIESNFPDEIEIKGIFQDVTQKKLLINQLESNLNKEKELNNLKSRFISMTSHEFKTPLSTINSSTELIEIHAGNLPGSTYKDKILSQIQRIFKQVSRLGIMMNDILMLEKNQANLMDIKLKKVKIGQFLQEFSLDFEEENDTRKLKVILPEKDFDVLIDKNILFYILNNLTSNAFKYSIGAPAPELHLIKQKTLFKLIIKDFGIGIPKDEQKHVFDSFFRGKNVETIKGTGLGLFIVKEFLQRLNGQIKFSSHEGKGTTFEIKFPIGIREKKILELN